MRQKDIVLIIVIVAISGFVSFFVSKLVVVTPKTRHQTIEVVDRITTDFPIPDKKYFNTNSVDPTQLIQIGNGSNPNQFNGAGKR
jgi:hypothetical protein